METLGDDSSVGFINRRIEEMQLPQIKSYTATSDDLIFQAEMLFW